MELEKTISPSEKKGAYEKYMLVVGVLGQLLFFFQAYHIFAKGSAQDVSFLGFGVSLVSVTSWLIYGLQIKNRALIISNIIACIGASLVMCGILLYG